jgi:hypothetical protein
MKRRDTKLVKCTIRCGADWRRRFASVLSIASPATAILETKADPHWCNFVLELAHAVISINH